MRDRVIIAAGTALAVSAIVCVAGPATNTPEATRDSYFVGYESEPAMDYGGRTLSSLDAGVCRAFGAAIGWERHTFLTVLCEGYAGGMLSVVQHEVLGHGGRAREFGLEPSYTFGLDMSGSTGIGHDPEDSLQNVLLAGGGIEADGVMAQRLLTDFYRAEGADGAKVPLLAFAKLDYTLYCWSTPDPKEEPADFVDAYEDGNDVAYYLVARQAGRTGADPGDVWNTRYDIDFNDPALSDTYDDAQTAALWNLADPAFWATVYSYMADHLGRRQSRIRPPVIPLGDAYGLTGGTRAFLGPDYVTSFLDVYLLTPGPLVQIYGRTLQNPDDTGTGCGAAVRGMRVTDSVSLGAAADVWQAPDAAEGFEDGTGWNAAGEVDTFFAGRWGVSVKVGAKSDGYFPGTPFESGVYGGAGMRCAF